MILMSTLTAGPADSYALREGGRKETIGEHPRHLPEYWPETPGTAVLTRGRLTYPRNGRRPLLNEGQTCGEPPGYDSGRATHKLLSSLCHHYTL